MKLTNVSLVLFLIVSIITLIGIGFDNQNVVLISKPIIIPAIYCYYLQIKNEKINWRFTFAILCCFIADMLAVLVFETEHYYILFLNLISYLVFFYFALKDVVVTKIKKVKIFYTIILLFSSFLVLFYLVDLISEKKQSLEILFLIYGTTLAFLTSLIGFNFFTNNSLRNIFALLMCSCFLISDLFYAINNFYEKIAVFYIINLAIQFLSYFFMVKYITSSKSKIFEEI